MANLEDSLKQGVAAMGGKGIDPATLYGIGGSVSALPPTGAWSAYGAVGNGGAPSSPAPQASAPAPQAAPAPNTIVPTKMPWHGTTPAPDSAAGAGSQAAMAGIGPNSFGLDPKVTLHHIMDYLLPRVRDLESKGDYKSDRSTKYPGQTASGAYQYTDSTWGGYKGYKRAVDAPPEIQDEKARNDFMQRLSEYGNDPFKAAAGHYFPRYAHDPKLWNEPLKDKHGNVIPDSMPVQQYLSKVLPPDRVANYMKAITQ